MEQETEKNLTVVVPNYNNSKYLEKCIKSILEQSLKPYEIIVVDDCSTDHSKELLQRLQQEFPIIKTVFLPKNKGVSNARNVGISQTSTEYITFMDSDDFYYNRDKLKLEMEVIRKYKARNKDVLAYSVTAKVSEDESQITANKIHNIDKYKFLNGKTKLQMISLLKKANIPRDYIIKKEILLQAGVYSYPKDFYEDLDLLMRIAMLNIEFYCTFQYGTAYRFTTGGLSKRKQEEHRETLSQICECYYLKLNAMEKMICSVMKKIRFIKEKFT